MNMDGLNLARAAPATRDWKDPSPWHLLQSGASSAVENMALDEILLQTAPQLGKPLLRFYEWTETAGTFGYSQRFAVVQAMTALRPLVRRPTGGGFVPHDADWTYSLVFPPAHWWYHLKAIESYQRLHQWVLAAFHKIGFEMDLATGSQKRSSGQCFIGAEQFDVVSKNRKIAGAAQRRSRHGFLIQGSIQPPGQLFRADWQKAFWEVAREQWGVEWVAMKLDPTLQQQVAKLVAQKYARREYNERR